MKTFETEKGNIPEGATHYANETDTGCFIWYREGTGEIMVNGYTVNEWESAGKDEDLSDLEPIPSVKTETLEEKPLDAIEQVEWSNGDIVCSVDRIMPIGVFVGLDRTGRAVIELNPVEQHANNGGLFKAIGLHSIVKPESPEAKKEREDREKGIHALSMSIMNNVKANDGSLSDCRHDIAVYLYDAGYRKGE